MWLLDYNKCTMWIMVILGFVGTVLGLIFTEANVLQTAANCVWDLDQDRYSSSTNHISRDTASRVNYSASPTNHVIRGAIRGRKSILQYYNSKQDLIKDGNLKAYQELTPSYQELTSHNSIEANNSMEWDGEETYSM